MCHFISSLVFNIEVMKDLDGLALVLTHSAVIYTFHNTVTLALFHECTSRSPAVALPLLSECNTHTHFHGVRTQLPSGIWHTLV